MRQRREEQEKGETLRSFFPSAIAPFTGIFLPGWKGPWAKYKNEEVVSKPSEEEKKELDEILAKRAGKKGKLTEAVSAEEKVTLHIKVRRVILSIFVS